ncbi:hypothetical protein FQA39_LY11763 [Lamprigera yunnana]|nr:hypothetical protein FQA39_LY11763 [Lamprigera yunnana]
MQILQQMHNTEVEKKLNVKIYNLQGTQQRNTEVKSFQSGDAVQAHFYYGNLILRHVDQLRSLKVSDLNSPFYPDNPIPPILRFSGALTRPILELKCFPYLEENGVENGNSASARTTTAKRISEHEDKM